MLFWDFPIIKIAGKNQIKIMLGAVQIKKENCSIIQKSWSSFLLVDLLTTCEHYYTCILCKILNDTFHLVQSNYYAY